jgi:hypothetical protein
MLSNALIGLGWARIGQKNPAEAQASLNEGLGLAVRLANQETVARALDAFAAMAVQGGDASNGAILVGGADGLRRSVGATVWAIDRANHDATTALLHARLEDDWYQELTSQGASLALADLLDIASRAVSRTG